MSRFRMYPTPAQEQQMLLHCAHARYVWNLAAEQHAHWRPGRRSAPAFTEQCRRLTEARQVNEWLAAGNADVRQQALKDFAAASNARGRFTSRAFNRATFACPAALASLPFGARAARR
ncbi:helix-turn-helix domain-containing protein [Streptomyces sp. Ag109_O5-1]|uniref:helix-turn-helix domain-containing protein n=1 Tax=Streptomyces sp. Ag109_O5-1 TaxID=1938851 RepID=UPI0021A77F0E|nr:helix-turn-helix domain-containing protein [Streptomyces sp. Ag109_O5-1]